MATQPEQILENQLVTQPHRRHFIVEIPIHSEFLKQATVQATVQATMQDKNNNISKLNILEFCKHARTRQEIQDYVGIKNRGHFIKTILNPMTEKGLLLLLYSDKPNSPKQKYYCK